MRHRWRQTLVSAGVALVLLLEAATHLPPGSPLADAVAEPAQSISVALTTEQSWGVFAPEPRQVSRFLSARVVYADGATATWEVPEGDPFVGQLRFYRWRKWMEYVVVDEHRNLWEPTARWVARTHQREGTEVVRVGLVRRFRENVPGQAAPEYEEFEFYALELGRAA